MKTIYHQFYQKDFYRPTWKIKRLFLGTFNPICGEKVEYYYGRSSNYTWPVLSKLFGVSFNTSNLADLLPMIQQHGIACMDMIHKVEAPENVEEEICGKGYSDAAIINKTVVREYNASNIIDVIKNNEGIEVYSTWGKGPKLKEWRNEIDRLMNIYPITKLVSPSRGAIVPKGVRKAEYILTNWQSEINCQ